ncbi:MAG: hypothetical protein ACD_30C00044G0006 [uncultured bacterium]|nr:MAG: hypothetical protein ACD_30C00044G0006 [uncultured bacterium]
MVVGSIAICPVVSAIRAEELMLMASSHPEPSFKAVPVKPVPSVTLPIFTPLTSQVPAAQEVKAGATDIPLIVLVAAPDPALIVGEISSPFVVEVTALVVASVKAKDTTDPVSPALWLYEAEDTVNAEPVVKAEPMVNARLVPVVKAVPEREATVPTVMAFAAKSKSLAPEPVVAVVLNEIAVPV